MFWTLDQMNQVIAQLASIEDLAENESIEETGVVFCCRILYILRHYQYLHCHNQPEARLIRTHAVREKRRKNRLVSFIGNAAAIVLCVPVTIECIQTTSVDGIVNGVEVRRFVDNFSNQTKSQITLAGASMALDIVILVVPGVGLHFCRKYGATLLPENGIPRLCGSIHFTFPQSDPDIVYPLLWCTKCDRSILGFLSGAITDLSPSAPLIIACIVTLCIMASLLLVLVIASYGPGLARMRPQ
ncbi:hypothetical protein BDR07DRAFT_1493447 [Suillus spraguei]|nr:hypothetical protein BDR07DRAFT_1493447 [Suillus spraguei]